MDKVIVFVPCYNAEKYIKKMLDSILGQTYTDFKVLIVDDGSIDRSKSIIQKYASKDKRVILYENTENKGVAYVRNMGLELCECEYMALMDADDVAVPERLEIEVNYLDTHPEIGAVGGLYQLIDEEGTELITPLKHVLSDSAIRANMLFFNPIANGSMMFRRKIVQENKIRYCESNRSLEDYLFWCEFLKYSKISNLDQVLQYYRISATSNECKARKEELESRNRCFDFIHENMYQMLELRLEDSDKEVLKKATHDTSDLRGIRERARFIRALYRIRKQGKNVNEDFNRELKTVCKEFACREIKNLVKGIRNV